LGVPCRLTTTITNPCAHLLRHHLLRVANPSIMIWMDAGVGFKGGLLGGKGGGGQHGALVLPFAEWHQRPEAREIEI
jgi:hypothetical protein